LTKVSIFTLALLSILHLAVTQEIGLGFLDLLLRARKCPAEERRTFLRQADLELDRLRYTVRLCHEIGLLSEKQYLHAVGLLAETGKLLGAWIKQYN
jgi:hypothetical protein